MTEPLLLGKYRILGQLAVGGMGEVLLARYEGPAGVEKRVVIKRVLSHLSRDEQFVRMFLQEARLAAMLDHPNVAQIFELGEDQGTYFLVMEHVYGRTLRQVMRALAQRRVALSAVLSARVCSLVLQGLDYAHHRETPVVHRDVSPENILIGYEGAVKLVDFGIAEAAHVGSSSRSVRGKVGYIAPELLSGAAAAPPSDIFALGAVLRELLGSSAPAALEQVVTRALNPNPAERWAKARDLVEALEDFILTQAERAHAARLAELMDELFPVATRDALPDTGGARATPLASTLPDSKVLRELTRQMEPAPAEPKRRGHVFAAVAVLGLAGAGAGLVLVPVAPDPIPAVVIPQPAAAPVPEEAVEPMPEPEPVEATNPAGKKKPLKKGTVDFRVRPYAEVFVGERRLGVTPFPAAVELPAGRYTITLVNKELNVRRQIKVLVHPGQQTPVREDLLSSP